MTAKGILLISILVLATGTAFAQKLGMTDRMSGAYVVSFKTTEGEVKVFLPDDMSGGDTVSAAVFAYSAAGKGAILNSYKIHTDYQSAQVGSGRITLDIPRNMSGSSLRVTLRDEDNREISYSTAAVKLPDAFAGRPESPTPFDFETPLVGQTGRLAEIRGPFDGEFATTQLTIGGRGAHVISESPRKLVFEVPTDTPGQAEIVLVENGVTVRRPFTALKVIKIGEDSSTTPRGVVPEGYTTGTPESTVIVQEEVTTEVIEETVITKAPAQELGLIEEELVVETEVVEETEIEATIQNPVASSSVDIAGILDSQLNVPLEGAAELVKAEVIDTVVVRELDVTEETESGGKTEVRISQGEIIEQDILEEEIVITDKKGI
ncbi:MAG: hypothetical protein MI861_19185, partial [Pirellulales bacterium]|nr:hypothetical protein [Pirellulales bacterium]